MPSYYRQELPPRSISIGCCTALHSSMYIFICGSHTLIAEHTTYAINQIPRTVESNARRLQSCTLAGVKCIAKGVNAPAQVKYGWLDMLLTIGKHTGG